MAKALGKTKEANQSEPLSKNECLCIYHCGLETQIYKEDTTLPELQSAYDRVHCNKCHSTAATYRFKVYVFACN